METSCGPHLDKEYDTYADCDFIWTCNVSCSEDCFGKRQYDDR